MRFVRRKSGRHRIGVTDLAFHITCPFLYISRKIFFKVTPAMIRGREEHEKRYRKHAEGALQLSLRQAVELSYTEKVIGREVWVSNGIVGGFIDYIEIDEGRIRVIEYKTTERAASWLPSHIQSLLYGVLVRDYSSEVSVEVRTFDDKLFFRKKIERKDEKVLTDGIAEFDVNMREGVFPKRKGAHCHLCPLRDECYKNFEVSAVRAARVHTSPGAARPPSEMNDITQ